MTIKVEFNGFDDDDSLGLSKLADLTEAMKVIAAYGENKARRGFAIESDPYDQKWIPSQRKLKRGGKTLTLSGALASSVNSSYDAKSARFGTNRPAYERVMFFGSEEKNIPPRPFLGITPEDEIEIAEIISNHLKSSL